MSYAGDISVEDAWRILGEDVTAQLVDVRTQAEWNFVGLPDLSKVQKAVVATIILTVGVALCYWILLTISPRASEFFERYYELQISIRK